jgi:hypothetical protein
MRAKARAKGENPRDFGVALAAPSGYMLLPVYVTCTQPVPLLESR